ncbi:MAG: hypothetical protein IPP47_33635 [Bryobacterales bacterium]|nr:hypothetical protein [Bryobacterales bacterium]
MKILIVASKLGYQTRIFAEAARRLGHEPVMATDRCGSLDDPWGDHAFSLKFHQPAESAAKLAAAMPDLGGIAAVGDKPALAAAHIAARLGLRFHSPFPSRPPGISTWPVSASPPPGCPCPPTFECRWIPTPHSPAPARRGPAF